MSQFYNKLYIIQYQYGENKPLRGQIFFFRRRILIKKKMRKKMSKHFYTSDYHTAKHDQITLLTPTYCFVIY
jgi:hypothetical protein